MNAIDAALARQAFPPGERALLDAFFALPARPSQDPRIHALGIGFGGADIELVGGVARIALANHQDRLPAFHYRDRAGDVQSARSFGPRRDAAVLLLPVKLFGIDWALSAPGISWPETYHAAWLPGYERTVVTASQDSDETHGVPDQAIGWFDAGVPLLEGARGVIAGWWRSMADRTEQAHWECFEEPGAVDAATAYAWAADVWPEAPDDDEEDEAEIPLRPAS
jgi:hypothetical protein